MPVGLRKRSGLCVVVVEGWEEQGRPGARPRPSLLSWGQAMAAKGLASGPTLLVSVRQALNNLYF